MANDRRLARVPGAVSLCLVTGVRPGAMSLVHSPALPLRQHGVALTRVVARSYGGGRFLSTLQCP